MVKMSKDFFEDVFKDIHNCTYTTSDNIKTKISLPELFEIVGNLKETPKILVMDIEMYMSHAVPDNTIILSKSVADELEKALGIGTTDDDNRAKFVLFEPELTGWNEGLHGAINDAKTFKVPLAVKTETIKRDVKALYPDQDVILVKG